MQSVVERLVEKPSSKLSREHMRRSTVDKSLAQSTGGDLRAGRSVIIAPRFQVYPSLNGLPGSLFFTLGGMMEVAKHGHRAPV